jgi:hypothetical protein
MEVFVTALAIVLDVKDAQTKAHMANASGRLGKKSYCSRNLLLKATPGKAAPNAVTPSNNILLYLSTVTI